MIVDALHAQVSELAAGGRVDVGEFGGGIRTGLLSLLAADASSGLWRRLVLGLVLLRESKHEGDGQDRWRRWYLSILLVFVVASLAGRTTSKTGLVGTLCDDQQDEKTSKIA